MSTWSDSLSACTIKQLVSLRTENQGWYKQLRCTIGALTSRKLSKQISTEEYAAERELVNVQVAECRRRGTALLEELFKRE